MPIKETLSAVAITLTFIAFIPYIRSILRGEVKPHVFSWVIWGATTLIVFFAQINDNGGAGAWPTGISSLITLYVAYLAFKLRADISIAKADWWFFYGALSSLPLWYFTADPLWAVVILTLVDLAGLAPTLRKAYEYPHEEQPLFFALIALRNSIAISALEHYSTTTLLFPAAIAINCLILVVLINYRRRVSSP